MTATETTALAPRRSSEIAVEGEWSVQRIVEQTKKIQECMAAVMKRDEHYGVIPGTGTKPTLLKAGAEKLCLMFRFDPEYEVVTSSETAALFAYTIRCILWHIPTGVRVASGLGACNSREEKYQRAAPKKCPQCGKETIIKGKQEYGGGWLCFAKKGGCGAKFIDGAAEIEKQETGVKDPSDLSNTILKMACKRALVAAVLNGTAASDCFTQDLEDLTEKAAEYEPPKASADPNPKADAHVAAQNMPAPGVKSAGGATNSGKKNDSGAAAIKHDGQYITEGQLKVLHITRKEVGGTYCTDEGDARTGWRKVLQVYRDQDGSRIESSKQLSKTQANHLINRLTDYKLKTQANLARGGEVTPIREPGSDDVVDEEMASTGDLTSLEHAAQERWGDSYKEMFPGWLKDAFDYSTVMELRKQEAIDAAQMIREGR